MTIDILSFGEPLFEFSQLPGQAETVSYLSGFGGDTSNFSVSAARQGANVAILAHLGSDVFGDQFVDLWVKEGVKTDFVVRNPDAPTGVYFISHDERGHHFTFYRKGSAASLITPQQIPLTAIADAKLLHTSAITHAISDSSSDAVFKAIEMAKKENTMISFDTNLRLKLWPLSRARAVIHETIRHVDFCMPSLDEAQLLTGLKDANEIADFYLNLGAKTVVLKMGKEGAMVATGDRRFTAGGHQVDTVDATGAGDCFSGAFLSQVVKGEPLEHALAYANCAAALTTTGYGAVAPIPTAEQVLAFKAEVKE
ncbi:sugar kinase [Vibrio cyclitrophicus]|uniref:sugar kinase n=1 Tax=Vibrio TaxID=662 RepID=UPI000C82686D|nr:sugar kinase [Vibrio cyclitrophicus]PMH40922.1 2-dehydro-3-deoxygluconokinase [Vibrio cyclitrophicus]PMH77509.1 2-dehydro-3-deoxygluconokinase [Vibrio cyclitrophicus]